MALFYFLFLGEGGKVSYRIPLLTFQASGKVTRPPPGLGNIFKSVSFAIGLSLVLCFFVLKSSGLVCLFLTCEKPAKTPEEIPSKVNFRSSRPSRPL